MQLEHFTTDAYPAAQRHRAWRETLHAHHLRPEAGRENAGLYGTLTAGRTPRNVRLTRIASSPQKLLRLADDTDTVWLALHLAGDATLLDGTRRIDVAPGDILYGSAEAATGMEFRSDFRQFIVQMPGGALKARMPAAQQLQVGSLSGRSGLGRLFAGTLGALSESFDSLAADEIAPIEFTLSEFIASSLMKNGTSEVSGLNASQAAMMRRLRQYIETALSDTDMTLATLAKRERVSERMLQKLFEVSGQTFATYLRQRRLERCRADLGNRLYGHLSISDICFRWGFNDPAHFSHAFRDRYEVSPRQYRQQAADVTQQTLQRTIRRGWPSGYREAPADPNEGNTEAPARQAAEPDPDPTHPRDAPACASPSGAVRHHHLPANDTTIHWGYFSRSIPPVLTVDSGDIVTIETLTQHAYDDHDRMIRGDSGAESVFHWTRDRKNVDRRGAGPVDASIYGRGSGEGFGVHICTGPVFVVMRSRATCWRCASST